MLLPHQRQYAQARWRALLDGSSGGEFEKLFHRLMELSDDGYVPVATHGNLGDLAADGLGLAGRRLYACYAPETVDAARVRSKFRRDLAGALAKRSGQFDTFVFVHNMKRGVEPVISGLLAEAQREHVGIDFEQLGPSKLWHRAMYLDVLRLETLLGESIPVHEVAYGVGMAEIEPLLRHLADNRSHGTAGPGPIPLPSTRKADFNRLTARSQEVLRRARPYTYQVSRYYQGLLDVNERDEVAEDFAAHYRLLRAELGDNPDDILWQMQGYVLGQTRATWERSDAADVVLTYFFEECDIFEVPPPGWLPQGLPDAAPTERRPGDHTDQGHRAGPRAAGHRGSGRPPAGSAADRQSGLGATARMAGGPRTSVAGVVRLVRPRAGRPARLGRSRPAR